jgi:hypothetical protein
MVGREHGEEQQQADDDDGDVLEELLEREELTQ